MPPKQQESKEQRKGDIVAVGYSGSIPSPAVLEEYERVIPGFGKKLVKNYLDESDHRRALENKSADLTIWSEKAGRITATAFAFFCVVMAVWLDFMVIPFWQAL